MCDGKMRNGPGKVYVRCDKCGWLDYELNEGDACNNPGSDIDALSALIIRTLGI